jgi:hypothetical protein
MLTKPFVERFGGSGWLIGKAKIAWGMNGLNEAKEGAISATKTVGRVLRMIRDSLAHGYVEALATNPDVIENVRFLSFQSELAEDADRKKGNIFEVEYVTASLSALEQFLSAWKCVLADLDDAAKKDAKTRPD